MLISYNWLKDHLGEDLPPVEKVVDLLTFHSFEIEETKEVEDDTMIEVNVLPDRAGSCLSHRGVALELAVLLDKSLMNDPLKDETELPIFDDIKIEIEDTKDCSRFMLALVEGIKVGPSPKWLEDRLKTLGQRSINNIVDATNYVMYGLGQPMHVYDADTFSKENGKWHFVVRKAKADETVTLLPEKPDTPNREVSLKGGELLIVDGAKDLPVGLAGVKGGTYAGLHDGTTNIILEAANFNPILTRKTARSLNILTDASKRFENEPSNTLPPYAIRAIVKLIVDIAGGELKGVVDNYPAPQVEMSVMVRPERVNQVLGLTLDESYMEEVLLKLGAGVEKVSEGLKVTAPKERVDLTIEENYIDEIGRVYGLKNVVSVTPKKLPLQEINANHYYENEIRQLLLEQGFSEVITTSFRKKDEIRLRNALARDKEYLRSSILPSLEDALALNIQNVEVLGLRNVRIFEIGTVFKKQAGKVTESKVLALGARIKKTGYSPKDDAIVGGALEALRAGGIVVDATVKQGKCEVDLSELIEKLPAPQEYKPSPALPEITYRPFSVYPAIVRDIAMWVPEETEAEKITEVLKANAGELCTRITLFDEFTKDDRTSFAFRLVFQSMERTLTDDEVETEMKNINQAVDKEGWEVR